MPGGEITVTTRTVDPDDPAVEHTATVTKTLPPVRIEYSARVDDMLHSFKEVMDQMQVPGGSLNPGHFFSKFSALHQQFGGGEQHDSHELLRHLLDSVLYVHSVRVCVWFDR